MEKNLTYRFELMAGMDTHFSDKAISDTVAILARDLDNDILYVKWLVLTGLIETAIIRYPPAVTLVWG